MFLERTRADSEALRANLSELLMAQGYQDITGQIIRSVIALVDELETGAGQTRPASPKATKSRAWCARCRRSRTGSGVSGRRSPGIANGDAVSGQDDIDALLSQMAAGK